MTKRRRIAIIDFDPPDDDDLAMVSGGRVYPMSANAADAMATSGMMLGDCNELGMRLGRGHRAAWAREHGWRHYRRTAPSGSWLRWDGCVVPSVWQADRERGGWPPPGKDVGGWRPLPLGTPTLDEALAQLNSCRVLAGLSPVEAWTGFP